MAWAFSPLTATLMPLAHEVERSDMAISAVLSKNEIAALRPQ